MRGFFVKPFATTAFKAFGLRSDFVEDFYSYSKHRVLRGLHFQLPPADHDKIVYCLSGRILDAVVDLRRESPTYLKSLTVDLDGTSPSIIYIPTGLAHGFYVQSASALVAYKVTSEYSPAHDSGILWDSAGIPWPDNEPILSERDKSFFPLSEFKTPF